MGNGLQCWDSNGNITVDLGDCSTRFFASIDATLPKNQAAVNISYPGVTSDRHFAAIARAGPFFHGDIIFDGVTVCTRDGGVWLISSVTDGYDKYYTVHIYEIR